MCINIHLSTKLEIVLVLTFVRAGTGNLFRSGRRSSCSRSSEWPGRRSSCRRGWRTRRGRPTVAGWCYLGVGGRGVEAEIKGKEWMKQNRDEKKEPEENDSKQGSMEMNGCIEKSRMSRDKG